MMDASAEKELLLLTNIPAPYRTPFFNALHSALGAFGAGLRVVYCAAREPNRHWKIDLEEQQYPWEILPGWHPSAKSWYPHINPGIVPLLRKVRPICLLSGGAWNTPTMLLAGIRSVTCSAPRIFWSEGHSNAVIHAGGVVAMVRRRALRTYDAYAVPNEASARFIRQEVGEGAHIVNLPNTVDDEFFSGLRGRRAAARQRLRLGPDQMALVCVAQLEVKKGILELLTAYEQLPLSSRAHLTLCLVGEGSLRTQAQERLHRMRHGDVRIVGHLDRDGVGEWLAAADAFILPTKRDPNPLSVIEAAFAGLPLIVSRMAGNCEDLVLEGETGYVINEPEPSCIADAIQRFLNSQGEWGGMGDRAFNLARTKFGRETVARQFAMAIGSYLASPVRVPI